MRYQTFFSLSLSSVRRRSGQKKYEGRKHVFSTLLAKGLCFFVSLAVIRLHICVAFNNLQTFKLQNGEEIRGKVFSLSVNSTLD